MRTKLFIFVLAFLFSVSAPFTVEYDVCVPDGVTPQLYGFPDISQTSSPWVSSLERAYYIRGILVNWLFFCFLFGIPILLLRRRLRKNETESGIVLSLLTICSLILLVFLAVELLLCSELGHFYWSHDFGKLCSPRIVLFPN